MVRFAFDDQDFFEVDPVRYAMALGESDRLLIAERSGGAVRTENVVVRCQAR